MANEVTIRLRDGDMAVLAAPRAKKATFRMSPQVMLAAAAGAVIGAIVALLVDIVVDTNFAEVWLVGAIVGALIGAFVWSRRSGTTAAPLPPLQVPDGPMTISIDGAGLKLVHADFSSQHAWRAITDVRALPEHLIISAAPGVRLVLPARDFASSADFHAYTAETLRLFNANRGGPNAKA